MLNTHAFVLPVQIGQYPIGTGRLGQFPSHGAVKTLIDGLAHHIRVIPVNGKGSQPGNQRILNTRLKGLEGQIRSLQELPGQLEQLDRQSRDG